VPLLVVRLLQVLKKICWYIVLAPNGVEQQTLLYTIAGEKKLGELVKYHSLIKQFTTTEVDPQDSLNLWHLPIAAKSKPCQIPDPSPVKH
jgi:type VI protein secretion system component VasK